MSDQDNNDLPEGQQANPEESTQTTDQPIAEGQQQESCLTCRYWLFEGAMTPNGPIGLCREGPPTVFMIPAPPARKPQDQQPPQFFSQFPPMLHGGWCGKWKKSDRDPVDVILPQPDIPVDVPMGNVTPLGHKRK